MGNWPALSCSWAGAPGPPSACVSVAPGHCRQPHSSLVLLPSPSGRPACTSRNRDLAAALQDQSFQLRLYRSSSFAGSVSALPALYAQRICCFAARVGFVCLSLEYLLSGAIDLGLSSPAAVSWTSSFVSPWCSRSSIGFPLLHQLISLAAALLSTKGLREAFQSLS